MELDRKTIETVLASGLPECARWLLDGATLDFQFTVSRLGLRRLREEERPSDDAPSNELLVFGEQDFAEGGGAHPWLCARMPDGWICGFDPDNDDDPVFLLNSSAERFVATFRVLNEYLASGAPLPPDCSTRLQAIDPEAYPSSDWRELAEHLESS